MKKVLKIVTGLSLCVLILVGLLYYRAISRAILGEEKEESSETEYTTEIETELVTELETELETETETESEEPEPTVQTVTISAVGDCALGPVQTKGYEGSFYEYYDTYGADYFFEGVKDIFSADDFTLVNLECVLTNETERVEKMWNIKGYPEYTDILKAGNVEACSLANNHTFDYGEVSHADTEAALDEAGILFGFNEKTAVYTTEDGVKIGIVSANLLSKSETDENYIRDGIEQLRNDGADIVIAYCHWGVETEHYPTSYQEETAHKIIDWGADLLIGAHPHVLQGIEVYNGKVICYSLGNFCFGANSNPSDKDTVIFQQTFTLVDGVLQPDVTANIIPCRVSSVTGKNDYQPTVLEGEDKQKIIDRMNKYSGEYREQTFDENGNLIGEE